MEYQDGFNISFTVAMFLFGFIIRTLWNKVMNSKEHSELHARISNVELLVAKNYVERAEYREFTNRLMDKLDRIEHKLDGKADREIHNGIP